MTRTLRNLILLLCLAALASFAFAQAPTERPFLSPMFSDHMVLQRDTAIPVWGWTTPGADITVYFNGTTTKATARADGYWLAKLPRQKAGGPFTMTVRGPQTVTLIDVLVGDVWLCSGQSNMEQGIATTINADAEIAAANDSQIRLYTVPHRVEAAPVQWTQSQWYVCSPETLRLPGPYAWNSFSGVAYYFGRELRREVGVPIGLLQTTWGGTPVEAWMSLERLRPYTEYKARLDALARVAEATRTGKPYSFQKDVDEWWTRNDPGLKAATPWSSATLNTQGWTTARVPATVEDTGMPNFDGVIWYRKSFQVSAGDAGKAATLTLGPIDDRDVTWVNGVKIGYTGIHDAPRKYTIPAGTLKPGENTIAVSIVDTGGLGGFAGTPEQVALQITNGPTIPLAGDWLRKEAAPLAKLEAIPPDLTGYPGNATVLYNGMVAPVIPYGIKGAIWYQGEANAPRAYRYQSLLTDMIADWRSRFNQGAFPFLIVQLANYMQTQPEPGDNDWAELREAQSFTAKSVRNTGIAVAIDIGEANDIHPKNKQDVGKRLALSALRVAYGKKVIDAGPTYRSMKVEGSTIRLRFTSVGGGLVAKGGPLKGFAIAGADRKFVWADARIDGDTIVVSSPAVTRPVAVRYAWAINPVCNLYNEEGLPASPFRTDKWPGITEPKK